MTKYNPVMQKATLAEVGSDVHGLITKRTAELDGVSVTQVTFGVGARWSNDLKQYAGTELCELPHVALVLAGTLGVRMVDDAEETFAAGDVMLLPPGHDAWTVGDEPCTFVEFSRGNDYYEA
jgi:ethanolamine utilization protein EutQ (cupin superfamily)